MANDLESLIRELTRNQKEENRILKDNFEKIIPLIEPHHSPPPQSKILWIWQRSKYKYMAYIHDKKFIPYTKKFIEEIISDNTAWEYKKLKQNYKNGIISGTYWIDIIPKNMKIDPRYNRFDGIEKKTVYQILYPFRSFFRKNWMMIVMTITSISAFLTALVASYTVFMD